MKQLLLPTQQRCCKNTTANKINADQMTMLTQSASQLRGS
jgi:hypothetical protein